MKKLIVIADKLNLRAEPKLTAAVIKMLNTGEELNLLSVSGDGYWYKVETNDDETGWVSHKYVQSADNNDMISGSEEFPWMQIAIAEIGVKEFNGDADNPRIVEYLSSTNLSKAMASQDETAWCSAFTNWCLEKAGYAGTDSAWARNWLNWGRELKTPRRGCIVVFSRGNGGHVGFYMGKSGSNIRVLGGNQGDTVSIASYPAARVLGYRVA
jgi:uncharacterized protein (TIGR02594 family)